MISVPLFPSSLDPCRYRIALLSYPPMKIGCTFELLCSHASSAVLRRQILADEKEALRAALFACVMEGLIFEPEPGLFRLVGDGRGGTGALRV